MKFLHCPFCIQEGGEMAYQIAVSEEGDLHILCDGHKLAHGGPFYIFKNDTIAKDLLEIGSMPCEKCGKEHEGGVH